MLQPYRYELYKTTYNNGKEFAHHEMMPTQLDMRVTLQSRTALWDEA